MNNDLELVLPCWLLIFQPLLINFECKNLHFSGEGKTSITAGDKYQKARIGTKNNLRI